MDHFKYEVSHHVQGKLIYLLCINVLQTTEFPEMQLILYKEENVCEKDL